MVMPNSVRLGSADIIEMSFEGKQSEKTLSTSVNQALPHINRLRAAHRPVLVLANVDGLEKLSTTTRRFAVDTLSNISYDRIAVFGATTFNKALINLIAHAAGKSARVRVFPEQQSARHWLEAYA